MVLEVGDKVYLFGERQGYTVRTRNDRFIILTKPYNPHHKVKAIIVDLKMRTMGTDNHKYGLRYQTPEDCDYALRLLTHGIVEIDKKHTYKLTMDFE